jgi:hypothetical protein
MPITTITILEFNQKREESTSECVATIDLNVVWCVDSKSIGKARSFSMRNYSPATVPPSKQSALRSGPELPESVGKPNLPETRNDLELFPTSAKGVILLCLSFWARVWARGYNNVDLRLLYLPRPARVFHMPSPRFRLVVTVIV